MHVLMLTPMLPHPGALTGGALVMHGQLEALAAHHRVTLAALATDTPTERAAADGLRATGVDVHCVWGPPPTGPRLWARRWRLARAWLRNDAPLRTLAFAVPAMQALLDRLAGERRFDVVQVEDNAMGHYVLPSGIPTLLTEHEARTDADVAGVERGRWRRYQRAVWARFDRIQVFTPADAAAVRSAAPALAGRVRVNPFGVAVPPPSGDGVRNTVVFVGGFLHPPNVDAACWLGRTITPLLRERVPDARVLIVGSAPPRAVRALASDAVVVTGRVPDVGPYLDQAERLAEPPALPGDEPSQHSTEPRAHLRAGQKISCL
ncbi:MAG: glycosyltransferase family 4 protein, partial [Rhodothermales bacterium]|nr:glycosyltransferase family 4 protein [Rhodothermales bacterium]